MRGSSSEPSGCGLLVFLAFLAFIVYALIDAGGTLTIIGVIILTIAVGIILIEVNRYSIKYFFESSYRKLVLKKCKHGIRGGNIRENGQPMKCTACQAEYEQQELERIQQQQADLVRQKERERAKQERQEELKRAEQERQEAMRKAEEERKHRLELERRHFHSVVAARKAKKEALTAESEVLLNMDPRDFENTIATLFKRMGFEVQQTPYVNDGGKDIIATRNGTRYFIECKRYHGNIGRPLIQKLVGAMLGSKVEHGVFVTTSDYTKEAQEYAKTCGVRLINLDKLTQLMQQYYRESDNTYTIYCKECGESVVFQMFGDTGYKTCPNGHRVYSVSAQPKKEIKRQASKDTTKNAPYIYM